MTADRETGPQPGATPARPTKPYKGLAMEGFLARWYARNTGGARQRQSYRESARLVAVRRVMDVVRGDIEERTWQAFWRTAIEQQETKEVAAALDMTEANVRNAKSRVLARIREELGALS